MNGVGFFRNLMLATAAILVAAVLFEGGARLVFGPPAAYLFTPPYRDHQTDFDVLYGTDDIGARVGCRSNRPQIGKMAVIGDSFAFGQGVADHRDFSSLLGCSADWNVRNLGSIGQDFLWYDAALKSFVDRDSNVVFLLLYENDAPPPGWNSWRWSIKRWAYRNSHIIAALRKARRNVAHKLHEADLEKSKLDGVFNNPLTVIGGGRNFLDDLADPSAQQSADLGAAVADFVADARRIAPGARIFVAMAPEPATLSPGHRAFYRRLGQQRLPDIGPSAFYRHVQQACGRTAGCRFIDIYGAFAQGEGRHYFPHDFHWNESGHRLMADLLEAALRSEP